MKLNQPETRRPRVCAVSYLNTMPLVWGMLHGRQRGVFDLRFEIPSRCADLLAAAEADIGLVPSFELTKQQLEIVPGLGIACHGPVRSILLIAKRPASQIRRLAADASSRTSVQLARVILRERYGAEPEFQPHEPDLEAMLRTADAALIIGDPALRIDPAALDYEAHDLGAEWVAMTGRPMVFAVWAGRPDVLTPEVTEILAASARYGREHVADVVKSEAGARGFAPELVEAYLTRHIVHELGEADREGLDLFLRMAAERRRSLCPVQG